MAGRDILQFSVTDTIWQHSRH